MSTETTTETPTTTTEGATSSAAAAAASLLTSTDTPATTTATASETAQPAAAAATPAAATPAAEEPKPAAETPKPEGAPEKYEFKAPEGKQYPSDLLEPFSAAAKEAGLSQDAAQKVLDTMAPKLAERQSEQVKAVQTGWADASKSDKDFGGEKLAKNLAVAKKGLEAYASPELKTLLNDTGLGNHPEVIRMFLKVGQSVKEDTFVGGEAAKGPADIAKSLYPNTPQKDK